MEAWLTSEWQRNGPWQLFLRPISWLFGLLVWLRRGAFRAGLLKSYSVGVPVIIVGNISVGGTGKTPLVLALVERLTQHGMHCGIVTRGYQRRSIEVKLNVIHAVSANMQDAVVSDEATLLARRSGVPVYAAANRVAAAKTLLANHVEVDVIVSDDGLQHYALRRDIEICVIDGERGLGNGGLLPAGPLREPASRLRTVDAIVVNCARTGAAHGKRFSASTAAFDMSLANEHFVNLNTNRCIGLNDAVAAFQGKDIHAMAGTGHPQRFFSHLVSLGFQLTTMRPFPDHHDYCESDLSRTDAEIILMTEKDAVKCGSFADERMWFMRIDAVLSNDFTDFVLKKLSARKA